MKAKNPAPADIYAAPSSQRAISSMVRPDMPEMRKASCRDGSYFPVSIALMLCGDSSSRPASSCWPALGNGENDKRKDDGLGDVFHKTRSRVRYAGFPPLSDIVTNHAYMLPHDDGVCHHNHYYHPGFPGAVGRVLTRASRRPVRAVWRHLPGQFEIPRRRPFA